MEQPPLTSPFVDLFLELCTIPSPSGRERAVADRVGRTLTELGLEWDEDDAAVRLEGDTGNLYCRIPPTNGGGGTPIFLCAHTDTVPPIAAIEPVVGEDGVIRNGAGTILGCDNKAAVVVMLEAVRRVLDDGREHAGIELLFTPQEEVSLRGAAAFDHTRLVATTGYVYDQAAPIGQIILGSPHGRLLDFRFHGTASHAGMYPEDGRSAIAAASRAIADFRLGRVDEETSANVGVITGGSARNVVPEWCSFSAEVRSHDERKAIDVAREMVESAAFAASLTDCEVESEVRPSFPGYRFRESDEPVRLAATALARAGYTPSYALSGGGADANVFNARGLRCVNLANGALLIHTPDEHVAIADLEGMVEVTLELIAAARESD
ncbi:MAG TPA: M20/M25/M40 family metallo-hydrolase [Gaiellaceae bacterium]|nr:M20/M25/M40 family metallo-hydrolase [Gaiellaceae bacterium]